MNLQIINGVECYVDESGVVQLNLEHVARGLGFTQNKNGVEYVRWEVVNRYVSEMMFSPQVGKDKKGPKKAYEFMQDYETPKYVSEPIFYLLAMKAENETAKKFQRTVAFEILPAIRKHGMYAKDELLENPDLLIEVATQLKNERQRRKALQSKVEQDVPKVLFADAVAASNAPMLIGELAKILRQNGVETGEKRLFEWMRSNGYLIKRIGTDYNAPTQRAMELGLFEVKETAITHSDGHVTINRTTKVTGKGQQYFINRFLGGERSA